MQQLSGLDASFIYFEAPNAPMHVASLSIYDPSTAPNGAVTFKGILRTSRVACTSRGSSVRSWCKCR